MDTLCIFCHAPLTTTSDHARCPMWLHRRGVWACRECYSRRCKRVRLPVWHGDIEEQSVMRFVA